MKPKFLIVLSCILLMCSILLTGTKILIVSYNNIVRSKQSMMSASGMLETEYNRRYTLVKSVLSLAKSTKEWESSLIKIEKDTYMDVVNIQKELFVKTAEAKASATKMNISVPESINERAKKENGLGNILTNAMDKLMVMAQKYPEINDPQSLERPLKDRTEFFNAVKDLKVQITNIESDIRFARNMFNESVKEYNYNISVFPACLISKSLGFKEAIYFETKTEEIKDELELSL